MSVCFSVRVCVRECERENVIQQADWQSLAGSMSEMNHRVGEVVTTAREI